MSLPLLHRLTWLLAAGLVAGLLVVVDRERARIQRPTAELDCVARNTTPPLSEHEPGSYLSAV